MGNVYKTDFMQLVRKANKEQEIFEDFELTIYEQTYKLRISMPDIFDILEEQQIERSAALARCRERGLDQLEPDEAKWQKQLEDVTDPEARKELEKNKPQTLAHQNADEIARLATIRTLLPKIIKYQDGSFLCKNSEEQKAVGKYMANNGQALKIITEVWVKIMGRYSKTQETIKNSSTESKDQNSDSK